MPREAHYELTDTEERDLIKLIEQGKPLPEKYRFLLFEDKREVELVWNGKTARSAPPSFPSRPSSTSTNPGRKKPPSPNSPSTPAAGR